jgi:nucleoside-diphosphate kinase
MIKPDVYTHTGKIIDALCSNGFVISKLKMTRMNKAVSGNFYQEHTGKPFFGDLQAFMESDVVTGMELINEGAVDKWRNLIGPTNSLEAKSTAPNSIRGVFGTDGTRNAVHGSDSGPSCKREVDIFFSQALKTTAIKNNCTCCIIKPHVIMAGNAGKVIDMILSEGFEISAMQMFTLDKPTAEEFFEIYKGVIPNFIPMIEHMTTGPCIVMEIR